MYFHKEGKGLVNGVHKCPTGMQFTRWNFRWCKISRKCLQTLQEKFSWFLFCGTWAIQATPLPNDCHASSLTRANLAPPKLVPVKIDTEMTKQRAKLLQQWWSISFLQRQWSGYHNSFQNFRPGSFFHGLHFTVADQSVKIAKICTHPLYTIN